MWMGAFRRLWCPCRHWQHSEQQKFCSVTWSSVTRGALQLSTATWCLLRCLGGLSADLLGFVWWARWAQLAPPPLAACLSWPQRGEGSWLLQSWELRWDPGSSSWSQSSAVSGLAWLLQEQMSSSAAVRLTETSGEEMALCYGDLLMVESGGMKLEMFCWA